MRKHRLNWLAVGFALTSIHYGLGFLIGTGEAIFSLGNIGILYGISTALGVLSLALISGFYWKRKEPIWELLGNKYGLRVNKIVSFLSASWMLGVVASQMLGGAWALSIFGFNYYFSLGLIALLIYILSILDIGKLSKVFFYMLIFSSIVLTIILLNIGIIWLPKAIIGFVQSFSSITIYDIVGIIFSTILVTFIGMDFHQFIVNSKSSKEAITASIFSGVLLITSSFLLLALVKGSIESGLLLNVTDAKQTLPLILFNFGNKITPIMGIIFSLPIIFVSIGSGSAVSKIVSTNILEFVPNLHISKQTARLITVFTSIAIALTGSSIINMIVSFYSIYVASVIIPFLLYVWTETNKKVILPKFLVENSLILGSLTSLFTFLFYFIDFSPVSEHLATYIMAAGIGGSIIGALVAYIVHSFFNFRKGKSLTYEGI